MHFQVIINSFSGFGPYCLCFKENEPCTVYDLKQRLAKTTAFSVEEQRIRSLGGRILTDSDDLFQDYSIEEGPIILNLTVSLIGGRVYKNSKEDKDMRNSIVKKIRLPNKELPIHDVSKPINEHKPNKGKEKETRKRKLQ